MPNRHSGIVLVTCADWAYHVHQEDLLAGSTDTAQSRLLAMVSAAVEHPLNEARVLPHILRVEAPAVMVGDVVLRQAFCSLSPRVLGGAHTVFIDGHSSCAGVLGRYGATTPPDQFGLQRELMLSGSEELAKMIAATARRPVTVVSTYTQFGQPGEVLDVREVCRAVGNPPTEPTGN